MRSGGMKAVIQLKAVIYAPLWLLVDSFPAPRFDIFCEQVTGTWRNDANQGSHSVDEVMRSCGGAVQGIQDTMTDMYFNRADDGFLYWECGSFLHGPICDVNIPGNVFSANLGMEDLSRIRITASIDGISGIGLRVTQMNRFHKISWATKSQVFDVGAFQVEQVSLEDVEPINWQTSIKCQMASPSQSWMLPRAKWTLEDRRDAHLVVDKPNTLLKVQAWVSMDRTSLGTEIRFGAFCPESGLAKEILSTYNGEGKLQGVLLQKQGRF